MKEQAKANNTNDNNYTYIDAIVGGLGAIGGFSIVRSVAKAVVETKNPIVGAGLVAFEVAFGAIWGIKAATISKGFTKSMKATKEAFKAEYEKAVSEADKEDDQDV